MLLFLFIYILNIKTINIDISTFYRFFYGGTSQNRTEDESFADFCLTTWLRCHINIIYALKV